MSDDRSSNNAAVDANDEVLQWVTYRLGEENLRHQCDASSGSPAPYRNCTGSWCA